MKSSLRPVADLAGHPLTGEDLEKVRAFLEDCLGEIRKLRELTLPDDVEPVTQFRMERWDE